MIAVDATAGALVVDSLPFSVGDPGALPAVARALADEGVGCLVGYLGAMTPARLEALLGAGLAFMPVTYGMAPAHYSGPTSVAQCRALGLPEGCSVWLDLEGLAAFHTFPATLIQEANDWAASVADAGFMPCLYVGVPQPLTSEELYALRHVRYWHGQGEVRDRYNRFANPECGWTMRQKYPSIVRGGIKVDDNAIGPDLLGRLPVWVRLESLDVSPALPGDDPV